MKKSIKEIKSMLEAGLRSRTRLNSIFFAELELELEKLNFLNSNVNSKKKQLSSSSPIECFNFIDSNLSKRSLAYF